MTSSEYLPITRREMRTFLDKARSVMVGRVGQNVIEDLYRLFNLELPKDAARTTAYEAKCLALWAGEVESGRQIVIIKWSSL